MSEPIQFIHATATGPSDHPTHERRFPRFSYADVSDLFADKASIRDFACGKGMQLPVGVGPGALLGGILGFLTGIGSLLGVMSGSAMGLALGGVLGGLIVRGVLEPEIHGGKILLPLRAGNPAETGKRYPRRDAAGVAASHRPE